HEAFPDLTPAAAFGNKWLRWLKDPSEEATPLHVLRHGIPVPVSQFVARLMAKDPEMRYGSAEAALEALQPLTQLRPGGAGASRFRGRESVSVEAGTATAVAAPPPKSKTWQYVAMGVGFFVLAIGAVIGGARLRREPEKPAPV